MNKLLQILTLALMPTIASAEPLVVKSPDGQISLFVEENDGVLSYSVQQGDDLLVAKSAIEIFADAKMSLVDHSIRENDSTWSPTWGQFSEIRDHYRELSVAIKADDIPVTLLCRVYDSGVGLRFALSKESKGKTTAFPVAYNLSGDWTRHFYPIGEKGVNEVAKLGGQKSINVPLVSQHAKRGVLALLESDLYSAAGFESMRIAADTSGHVQTTSRPVVSVGAGHLTPWRVILVGESQADLLENTVALSLAAPCALDDASWVKPGKGLWDWRIHGYDNGEFTYGIDTRSYLRLIDFCEDQGIEYLTIDDHWFNKATPRAMTTVPQVDLDKVMAYAKQKRVKICLYYDRRKGDVPNTPLFKNYADLGASAMKYGFHGNQAAFTRDAIETAAIHQMLINFHDGPSPMTGVERTMPNLITREYCHAQQDSRRAFTPESFLNMAMVNSLVGPMDQANGNFGIKSINAGERMKGPKKKNSYISTVVSEVARCLVVYTGLITLPDAPEEYLKKADLFEFLKVMPATWDDTRVPHAKIDEAITVVRRSGDTWFVGSVNNQMAKTVEIELDFLEPNTSYEATLYQDAPKSHGVNNPEVYEIKKQLVNRGDTISATMAVGGGHAMILRPAK
ncbi:glycoside hydrolase family 97 catalytic domain-containing protein [Novipirellula sp. SH528]|uniref:glycoside hydrolase family 97 protein n=1 Tax=Novipirellula sp. SH528 TaxID=3454466 RepID=UPI003FA04D97